MSISRAKTLCAAVHNIANTYNRPLHFKMVVRGSNSGCAEYTFNNNSNVSILRERNKDGGEEDMQPLSRLAELEIGTLSKVRFINHELDVQTFKAFVENVVRTLRDDKIHLWTLRNEGGEMLFRVLKSSTTADEYGIMLEGYNTAETRRPAPVKVNRDGYPSRSFALGYKDMGVACEDFNAYPASHTRGDRPIRPPRNCDEGQPDRGADGSLWQVDCLQGESKRVCKWKVMEGQSKKSRQNMPYAKIEQIGHPVLPRAPVEVPSNRDGDQASSSSNLQPTKLMIQPPIKDDTEDMWRGFDAMFPQPGRNPSPATRNVIQLGSGRPVRNLQPVIRQFNRYGSGTADRALSGSSLRQVRQRNAL